MRAAFRHDFGTHGLDARINLVQVGPQRTGAGATGSTAGDRLIEPLHLVMQGVQARHPVLDPIEALQIRIDHFEGLFEIVEPVSASAPAATACPEKGRRHDQQ